MKLHISLKNLPFFVTTTELRSIGVILLFTLIVHSLNGQSRICNADTAAVDGLNNWRNCFNNLPATKLGFEECQDVKLQGKGSITYRYLDSNYRTVSPMNILLERDDVYDLCGTYPSSSETSTARVEFYERRQSIVDGIPVITHTRIAHREVKNIKEARWSYKYKSPSTNDFSKNDVDAIVIVMFDFKRTFNSSTQKYETRYEAVNKCQFNIRSQANNIIPPPKPVVKPVCEKGLTYTTIQNPNKAEKLYFFGLNPEFDVNFPQTLVTNTLDPVKVVSKNASGHFSVDFNVLDNSHTYFMGFGSAMPGVDSLTRLSALSPFALILIEANIVNQLPENILDTVNLIQCPDIGFCNLPEKNYHLLYGGISQKDSIYDVIKSSLSQNPLFANLRVSIQIRWEQQKYAEVYTEPTGFSTQRVCYENLNKTKKDPQDYNYCREYTMHLDVKVNGSLHYPNLNAVGLPVDIGCTKPILSKVICQEVQAPQPMVSIICDSAEKICLPCNSKMRGLEFWTAQNGGTLLQAPPTKPVNYSPPLNHFNSSESFNECSNWGTTYTIKDRFCLNSPADTVEDGLNLVWMNYVNHGGRKSTRVPLARIGTPLITPQKLNAELLKPTGGDECEAGSSVIMPKDNSGLDSEMNAIVSEINATSNGLVKIKLEYATHWEQDQLITWNSGLLNKVCYNNLPDGGGTCSEYTLYADLYFTYTYKNPCDTTIVYTYRDTCTRKLIEYSICKAMYPPVPEVFLICDGSVAETVCLKTIENYPNYEWSVYDDENKAILDTTFKTSCIAPATNGWSEYAASMNANSPNIIRFDVRSVSNYKGLSRKSGTVPVIFVILPNASTDDITAPFGLNSPSAASDDDFKDYCATDVPEAQTYYDLTYDSQSFEDDVDQILEQMPSVAPGFQGEININLQWQDQQYITNYKNVDRVCYGNLQAGDATASNDKGREYFGSLASDFQFCIDLTKFSETQVLDPIVLNSPELYKFPKDRSVCSIKSCNKQVAKRYVYKATFSAPDACDNTPGTPTNMMDCKDVEYIEICPGDNSVVIGNRVQTALGNLPNSNYSYLWNEPYGIQNSLSSTTERNPTWYNSAQFKAKNVYWYTCLSPNPVPNQTPLKNCVAISICPTCTSQSPKIEFATSQQDGLSKIPSDFDFSLAPNPTSDVVWLSSNSALLGQKYQLTDVKGTVLLEGNLEQSNQTELNLSKLARGTYFIQVYHPDNIKRSKLVVKE